MQTISVKLLPKGDDLPYALLLLADQSIEVIDTYIHKCHVYVLYKADLPIGVCAVRYKMKSIPQIMNFAIQTELQKQGLGSFFMHYITGVLKAKGCAGVLVGTNDCGIAQITFYRTLGFVNHRIIENYFIDHYPEPIIENGVMLKDMLLLKKTL